MAQSATLFWLRRDLRRADHPGWHAALEGGGPVIPVFLFDEVVDALGAAPAWRLGESVADLARSLASRGSRLVLRRGHAADALVALARETGARRIVWSRAYDARSRARDESAEAALREAGVEARTVGASLLFEPWTVETKSGGPYRVFTPFWRAVRGRDVPAPLAAPRDLSPPEVWPRSDRLADWRLGVAMNRGAAVVARHARAGEAAARARLDAFAAGPIRGYAEGRDFPSSGATSGLSENLSYGEISPRTAWHAGRHALAEGAVQAESFLRELAWREFAYHLLWHSPRMETANWRGEWDRFPWRPDNAEAERWRRGMTGVEIVDAAIREMWVTGTMHNRMRMVVASYLTKHLLTDWRVGDAFFRDCLIDWDVASNALGWQWVAGSGPDAAPYFRILNPETQAAKFDPDGAYRDRFIAEGRARPHEDALAFFDAVPRSWGLLPDAPYPQPVATLAEGRERALAAYRGRPGGR